MYHADPDEFSTEEEIAFLTALRKEAVRLGLTEFRFSVRHGGRVTFLEHQEHGLVHSFSAECRNVNEIISYAMGFNRGVGVGRDKQRMASQQELRTLLGLSVNEDGMVYLSN